MADFSYSNHISSSPKPYLIQHGTSNPISVTQDFTSESSPEQYRFVTFKISSLTTPLGDNIKINILDLENKPNSFPSGKYPNPDKPANPFLQQTAENYDDFKVFVKYIGTYNNKLKMTAWLDTDIQWVSNPPIYLRNGGQLEVTTQNGYPCANDDSTFESRSIALPNLFDGAHVLNRYDFYIRVRIKRGSNIKKILIISIS